MKTKNITTLLTAIFTIALAASAYAAPPGKGIRLGSFLKKSDTPKVEYSRNVERKVERKSMHRVGPPGKGYVIYRR